VSGTGEARRLLVVSARASLIAAVRGAELGVSVAVAGTPEEAVGALEEEPAVAVLLDDALPEADRPRLLGLLRGRDAAVPIVLVGSLGAAGPRLDRIRDLGLHGAWDENEAPARLRELVESARAWRRRERELRGAQELRELVVAKLCHDMRNHLHVIRGYTDILRSGVGETVRDDVTARLERVGGVAVDLVLQYLELARVWWTAADPRDDEVRIDALFDELRTLAMEQVGSRPVIVTVHAPVAGASIQTDERKLRAILLQLLAHAIKFTPAGGVLLTVSLEESATDFLVVDEAPSIVLGDVGAGFASLRNLGGESSGDTPGQGIGLALAQRLTALLGGTLDAIPGEPCGTVFRLRLPVRAVLRGPESRLRYH
jgi:signal transduction histidine kinase